MRINGAHIPDSVPRTLDRGRTDLYPRFPTDGFMSHVCWKKGVGPRLWATCDPMKLPPKFFEVLINTGRARAQGPPKRGDGGRRAARGPGLEAGVTPGPAWGAGRKIADLGHRHWLLVDCLLFSC